MLSCIDLISFSFINTIFKIFINVLQYEPVFTPGNEQHVHHMIVYECTNLQANLEKVFEDLAQSNGHPCYQDNMSKLLYTCNHVVVVWTLGSGVSFIS